MDKCIIKCSQGVCPPVLTFTLEYFNFVKNEELFERIEFVKR